jgi:hypothetical protein
MRLNSKTVATNCSTTPESGGSLHMGGPSKADFCRKTSSAREEAHAMKEIRLWALESDSDKGMRAVSVDAVRDTDTEQMLEELLVASPHLLMNRLRLIGRQLPTQGGPLDLLGLDETGRLVVFELKRGTLTRDAVAQAIDYASDLNRMDNEDLFRHLEDCSGHGGIEPIRDFQDWYNENYPNSGDAFSEKPRIILVGLGGLHPDT